MSAGIASLQNAGVSIWLDDLSRSALNDDAGLKHQIAFSGVTGVTTNPAIFSQSFRTDPAYQQEINQLQAAGKSADEIVFTLAVADVRAACDLLADVHRQSDGKDGYVSLEVDPAHCNDTAATVQQGLQLHNQVARPNLMIKVPATAAGLEAITELTAQGVCINATLIFSLTRYREVLNAYFTGIEIARTQGLDIRKIHSVASFFISRLDTEVNSVLGALQQTTGADTSGLRNLAGVANGVLAYEIWQTTQTSARAQMLLDAGANMQRLLWASTGVKEPDLPADYYVRELTAPYTVNTMPAATLASVTTSAVPYTDKVTCSFTAAAQRLDELTHAGVNYSEVTAKLETDGLTKFKQAWNQLLAAVTK